MISIRTIDMFMWGYQNIFQISINNSAQDLFNNLKSGLDPEVFLIGIWENDKKNPTSYNICIEPEDIGYERSIFSDVKKIARDIKEKDPEKQFSHSDDIAQKYHEKRIELRAIKNAIESILISIDQQQNKISYVSSPINVRGYLVCVVLQLNKFTVNTIYSLKQSVVNKLYPVSTSVLDATITKFFASCSNALQQTDPGANLNVLERETSEIIRSAGNHLMKTLSMRLHSRLFNLFELCNLISAQRYEGAESNGKLIITHRNHQAIYEVITLSTPVSLQNHRSVRKLLEMATSNLSLLSDGNVVYGLGGIENYNPNDENLFVISFKKHFTWELIHANNILMKVEYGKPQLIKERIKQEQFSDHMSRIFSNTSEEVVKNLWGVVLAATEQKHGTMVVISSGAKEEADRLKNQCTVIKSIKIAPDTMKAVTAIDGAVLLNPSGDCLALGVILDGLATKNGDPSRGARFNSAIRYLETQTYECLIIVISEDGHINLIPELKPRIPRENLDSMINKFRELNTKEEINVKQFHLVMEFLQQFRFYLLEQDCNEINQLRRQIEGKIKNQFHMIYNDFVPSPEMNETYYI